MTARTGTRRAVSLAVAAALGVLLGVGLFFAVPILTAPAPRAAPGWSLLADMPDPRGETASAVADGRVYVAGGFLGLAFETTDLVSVYDAGANTWTPGPPLPEPRNHAAAAALDGTVYVSGGASAAVGDGPTDSTWALAPGSSSWTMLPPMPGPRSGHRVVALDGRLFVVGGVGGAADPSAEGATGRVLIYDVAAGSWTGAAAMPLPRDHLAVVVVDDEIWAIGGRAGGTNHARVDIYDPATDTWRDGPQLPHPTSGAPEAMTDGVIYLSGGEDPGAGTIVDRHWRLDTTTPEPAWEPLPPPPLAVHGVTGISVDGRFLVIGGSTRPGGQSNTAWTGATQAFDPREMRGTR